MPRDGWGLRAPPLPPISEAWRKLHLPKPAPCTRMGVRCRISSPSILHTHGHHTVADIHLST